ncbi:MAG: TIM barrel protein [Planctomycetota bacterium]
MLVDLEFTAIELAIHEEGPAWIRPAEVVEDVDRSADRCRDTLRLSLAALSFDSPTEASDYYEKFAACCKLAKALKVVPIVVPAAELGTPFNAEIERLQELVRIASLEGCLVALQTQIGCMTEDPDTAAVLCDNVKGLGISLDPSHYVAGPWQGRDYAKLVPYVYHVRLRDSTKTDLHVRVGQGEIDYGKVVSLLEKAGYSRALCIHMAPLEGFDHRAEMRKTRLLLESLL